MSRTVLVALCGFLMFALLGTALPRSSQPAPGSLPAGSARTAQSVLPAPPAPDPGEVQFPARAQLRSPFFLNGGADCNSPVVLPSIPLWLAGTTEPNGPSAYEIDCPRHPDLPSPDLTYAFIPAADVHVNISLCNPGTTFDSRLYVFQGACPGVLIACDDDSCPNRNAQILDLALVQGETYFIVVDGFNGGAGPYEMTVAQNPPPAPACPPSSPFSQPATGEGTAGMSDVDSTYVRYERYTLQGSSPIAALRFWGVTLRQDGGSWLSCAADPKPFTITFYRDQNGEPNTAVPAYQEANVSVHPAASWVIYNGYPIYQYELTLSSMVDLADGWISIQGQIDPNNPGAHCRFFWMSAPTGDGRSWYDNGNGLTEVGYDLSLCLSTAPLAPGACCLPGGACQMASVVACQTLGGVYHGDGVPCDPNLCVVASGACCLPSGACQMASMVECQTLGGVYHGDGVPCDPNLCEAVRGACCVTDHTCVPDMTQADCGRLLRGDCNCDGHVDFGDINPFVSVLAGGTPCLFANCDVNGDGHIDFGDINPFVEILVNGNQYHGVWMGPNIPCDPGTCP